MLAPGGQPATAISDASPIGKDSRLFNGIQQNTDVHAAGGGRGGVRQPWALPGCADVLPPAEFIDRPRRSHARHQMSVPPLALTCLAAGLLLSGCGSISLPTFGSVSSEPPPNKEAPPLADRRRPPAIPPEEIIGRWGLGLGPINRDADRPRTEAAGPQPMSQSSTSSRSGPGGGVMMHLADQRQPSELRLKGGPGGKNYIGPADAEAGGPSRP